MDTAEIDVKRRKAVTYLTFLFFNNFLYFTKTDRLIIKDTSLFRCKKVGF